MLTKAKPEDLVAMNQQDPQPQQVINTAEGDKLMQECCGLRLSFYGDWPEGQKTFTAAEKQQIADRLGVEVSAISGSRKMYDTKHPMIKEVNKLKSGINSYWRSMTMPLAEANVSEVKAEKGVRLVRMDQADTVLGQFEIYLGELATLETKINDNREEILESAKKLLKSKYEEAYYPDRWELKFRWGYTSVTLPSYLEQLAPKAYAKELAEVRQRFEDSYQLATKSFLEEFADVVHHWTEKLGPVTRIHPASDNPHYHLRGSKVESVTTPKDDPEIPEGMVRVLLKVKPESGGRAEDCPLMMTPTEYQALKPTHDPEERKVLRETTFERMFAIISQFRNLGETMSAGPELIALVDKAAEQFKYCNNPKAAARDIKTSTQFRMQTRDLMEQLGAKLDEQLVTKKASRRRLIIKKPSAS